mmetsp:Transcript_43939/g.107353  ORF Transcript_43939/g.107353 Transcript_43939/m.107353 type:complete len:422 (-) Transcript_43939:1150-2415(-)
MIYVAMCVHLDPLVLGQQVRAVLVELPHIVHQVDRVRSLLPVGVIVTVKLDAIPRVPHVRSPLNARPLKPAQPRHDLVADVLEGECAVPAGPPPKIPNPHDVALAQLLAALDLRGVPKVIVLVELDGPPHGLGQHRGDHANDIALARQRLLVHPVRHVLCLPQPRRRLPRLCHQLPKLLVLPRVRKQHLTRLGVHGRLLQHLQRSIRLPHAHVVPPVVRQVLVKHLPPQPHLGGLAHAQQPLHGVLSRLPELLPVRVHEREQLLQRPNVAELHGRHPVRGALADGKDRCPARLDGILAVLVLGLQLQDKVWHGHGLAHLLPPDVVDGEVAEGAGGRELRVHVFVLEAPHELGDGLHLEQNRPPVNVEGRVGERLARHPRHHLVLVLDHRKHVLQEALRGVHRLPHVALLRARLAVLQDRPA